MNLITIIEYINYNIKILRNVKRVEKMMIFYRCPSDARRVRVTRARTSRDELPI
jgi:hypothetical protein